jgi:enoyl-CoA hydratase/carnithine racemase
MLDELQAAIENVRTDKDVRVVIITGAGKAFCTGIDLKFAQKISKSGMEIGSYLMKIQEIFRLEKLSQPTIAAINGYALGEGCDLALACDFRIAAKDTKIGVVYIKLGFASPPREAYRLIQLAGMSKAKELLLLGDMVGTEEALKIGLLNDVVPLKKLDATVLDLANRLSKGAPLAMGLTKKGMNALIETVVRGSADFYLRIMGNCFESEDAKEGVTAGIEKRLPVFKGK